MLVNCFGIWEGVTLNVEYNSHILTVCVIHEG